MALATISRPDLFPATTVVKAFALPVPMPGELLKNNSGDPATWKPALTLLSSPTVASNGTLEVTGESPAVSYLLWAVVGGKDVYLISRGGQAGGLPQAASSVSSSSPPAGVAVATTSTQLLAANPNRQGLAIENTGPTNVIYLGLGTAAVLKAGIGPVVVNGSWDGRIGGVVWTGSVFAIAETAGVTAAVVEV